MVRHTLMKRRQFVAAAGVLLGAGCAKSLTSGGDDEAAVKRVISDYYGVFYREFDKQKYRSLLTDDYLLLENGEIFDADGDIAAMPAPDSGYKRTDAFTFRTIKLQGDTAWAVYFLTSDVKEGKDEPRTRKWLESAILRRSASTWRVAILHSTRIAAPA
jgi:hypothetical protein